MATPFLDLARQRGVAFPLRTKRLTLTPFVADEADAVWAFTRLEEVWTWTSGRARSREDLLEGYLAEADRLTVRAGEVIVGVGKVSVMDAWSQGGPREEAKNALVEVGWTIDPAHAGRGYATELAHELLRLAFDDLGVHRVEANAFADNAASLRVMEKAGLRHEATFLGESLHLTRGWVDGTTYALLASEFAARKAEEPDRDVR